MKYLHLSYGPQLSQLEVLQPEQGLPPTEEVEPLSSLEKQAKLDKALLAGSLQ